MGWWQFESEKINNYDKCLKNSSSPGRIFYTAIKHEQELGSLYHIAYRAYVSAYMLNPHQKDKNVFSSKNTQNTMKTVKKAYVYSFGEKRKSVSFNSGDGCEKGRPLLLWFVRLFCCTFPMPPFTIMPQLSQNSTE